LPDLSKSVRGSVRYHSRGIALREHFRWLNGEGKLSSYESSPGKLRHFCSVRGSHVVAKRMGHPRIIIRVATLDVDPGITPQMHIWISHDAAWLRYDVFPAYIRNGNRGENEGSYGTLS